MTLFSLYEIEHQCPWCGERLELTIDGTAAYSHTYVEDCQVCCAPILVSITFDDMHSKPAVHLRREND
ncbi:MAG: CPXCG motif-containing cysteine-rich protein [Thiohalocapsa sp.]